MTTGSGVDSAKPLRGKAFRVDHVMGMAVSIDLRDARAHEDPAAASALLDRCFAELRQADEMFSLWRTDTPMARLSDGRAALRDMPIEVVEVLRLCARWSTRTQGLFTARNPAGRMDPTGLVKGWAMERVGRLLSAAGMRHWCLNAAGDVLVHGQARPGEGWTVGIVDPRDSGRLVDTVTITVGAVATSGVGERGRHIWDPTRGRPADAVLSATVISRDIVRADVMATAAVVRGRDAASWLQTRAGLEGLVLYADGTADRTSGWPGSTWATASRPTR